MSGPTSFRLSQETFELLKKNRDFYESLFDLQKKKESPLLPKATDAESRTESKLRDNGDVEVSLVLPVDDDGDAANGRIYVRDTFVFDPSERVLKSYQRSFEHNGKGGDEWKGWLGKYQALSDAAGRAATDPTVQKFAHRVARSYGRPIVDDAANTLPEIKAAFEKERRLLKTTNQQVLDLNAGLELKIKDKLNFYNLAWRDGKLEVTVQFSVDDDADAANGRILLRDKFKLDAETLAFEGFQRSWAPAPGAEGDARMQAALRKLQAGPDPSAEEAGAFIQALLPALLPKGEPDGSAVLALLGAGKQLPKDYRSPLARRGQGDPEGLKAAAQSSLEAMYVVAQEQVMKRYDESQGWLHFGGSVDQVKEKGLVEGLFQKAKAASEKSPGLNPFALFQKLELSGEEQKLRDRLLGDKLMQEFDALAHEPDAALRGKSLAILAQQKLLIDEGMGESAMFLAEQLKKDPATQRVGEDILAVVQGKGDFGQKVGYVLPLFCKEVSKPSMLLGMAAAPFMGTAFELGGLKLAAWAYDAKKISDIGRGAKLGAAVLGMTGEAVGFTAIHRGFERMHHGGDKAWNGAWQEIVSATLMFGGMRLTHGATGLATARMAEGAWGSKLGYRFGEGQFAGALGRSPTGRFFFDGAAHAAGKGVPTLTTSGKALSGTMNHLGGILTMQASGWASRKLGLMPENNQSFGANFFDATVMYTQAMVGSHAANMASGGSLHRNLGAFKMGVENLKKGLPVPPPASPAAPDPAAQAKPDPAQAPATPTPVDPNAAAAPVPAPAAKKPSLTERLRARFAKAAPEPKAPTPTADPAVAAPVDPAAAPAEAKKPSLLDRLLAGRDGKTKTVLEAAREWFGNLSPSKVKALQAELAKLRAEKSAMEGEKAAKEESLGELQKQFDALKTEREAARAEVEAKGQEIQGLRDQLTQIEGQKNAAETLVTEKAQALGEAEARLQDLEAKKTEAEQKLRDYQEQAELSELDLGVGTLEQQIEAHKAELGKLRKEKQEAEVQAGAHRLAADELRRKLTEAETELERRKHVDKALKESEANAAELGEKIVELKGSLEDLQRQVGELSAKDAGATRLTTEQAQKIAELAGLKTELEGKLRQALEDIAGLRKQVGEREAELKALNDSYEDVQAQLRSANHRVEQQERSITQLGKVKESLEAQKAELEQSLAAETGDKTEIQRQLDETAAKLKETNRELGSVRHDLEISKAGKKAAQEESARLRENIERASQAREKSEGELRQGLRDLEIQLREQGKQLEASQKEAAEIGERLAEQTQRAETAEGREAALLQQQVELQKQHEATQTELGKAQRRIDTLTREVEAKKAEIERHKTSIETYKQQIEGLRGKKKELDETLRQLRVEHTLKLKELEEVQKALEAEKAKEPEVVRDINAELELEARIEELTAEKAQSDRRLAELEGAKSGLETKVADLDAAKKELEKQLRSKEADLEIAQGAAKSANEDLQTLRDRSAAEETRLKKSVDEWRNRATEAEAGKATAEAKIRELDRVITEKRGRIETLERNLEAKVTELKASDGARKVLEGDVARLERDLEAQMGLLESKKTELEGVQRELGERIAKLVKEKGAHEKTIANQVEEMGRLNAEITSLTGRLEGVEAAMAEAKAAALRDISSLEGEKAQLSLEIQAKQAELRQKDSELINTRARVEELEGDLQGARTAAETARRDFETEKSGLEQKIAAQETALAEGRSALETAQAEVKGLRESLEGTNQELARERAAAKEWKQKFEGLEATSKAEAKRLRGEAEELRGQERQAAQRAAEAISRAESLDAALTELRGQKESLETDLSGKLSVAEQKAAREEGRARQAEADLARAKAEHIAEAERLRLEAAEKGGQAALAEAKAREHEAALETERARIRQLEGDLAAAKAEAEALLAPASLRAEAEQKAEDAGRRAARLNEELTVAEQGKLAAERRVSALEKELEALRSTTEAEAETLRTEAAGLRSRAEAAEARAKAAEGRIAAAEAEAEAARIEAAALRSDASGRSEAEATLGQLREEVAGLRKMVAEAEQRAADADRRAAEFEEALTASEQSAAESARQLKGLKAEKAAVDAELKALKPKLEKAERDLTEAKTKRREAESELLGARTRAAELEGQLAVTQGEIEAKARELKETKDSVGKIWSESQEAGRQAQKRIGELEAELTPLRNAKDGLEEQIQIERDRVREVEQTLELLLQSEEALKQEITALKGERNTANLRAAGLERSLNERQAEIEGLNVALENEQFMGFRGPHELFGGADPRVQRVETRLQGTALLGDAQGRVIGEAHLIAGGEEGMMKLAFTDGSRAAGRTSIGNIPNGGNGRRKFQEDGLYMSRFLLPDGTEVKVLAGADGAGGEGGPGAGAVASSAFLQGVHARVAEAAREGKVATAKEIFEAGVAAVELQRSQADRNPQGQMGMRTATGAGAVIVVVGNEAMVASVGDATVFLGRPNAEGGYDIQGYSNVDGIPIANGQGGWNYNQIVRGIHQYEPSLYRVTDLQPGDRFLIASDGFHENTSGGAYKQHGSRDSRQLHGFRPPTQETFSALRGGLKATRGRVDSASLLHDLALENIRQPGRSVIFEGEPIQLPQHVDKDNIFVLDYEHGKAPASRYQIPITYSPLEPVPTAEQIRAAEAAAERSTAKGFKVPETVPGSDPNYQPRISDRTIADFHLKYVDDLARLYGSASEQASQRILKLYLTFPEIEEVFNPSLLARAEDLKLQGDLFDAAKKRIDARKELGEEILKAAAAELEKIKNVHRPFEAPQAAEVERVLSAHQSLLERVFGERAAEAATVYAGILKNLPQVEATLGPAELAKMEPADFEKFYKRKLRPGLHRDKHRYNEGTAADAAFTAAEKLNELHQAAAEDRRASGWTSAKALETGLREWPLDTATEYVVGKNGGANIRIPDNGVSRRHFKIYARVNRWVVEDVGSTYGTFVNGQQVQTAQLKHGDRIQVGVDVELQVQIDGPSGAARLVELPKKPGAGLPGQPEPIPSGDGAFAFKIPRGRPVYIGRKQIPDVLLSPDHFELIFKGNGWLIRDMGSDTGTQLNGADIQAGVDPATQRRTLGNFHPIKDGALVTVGGLTFRFHESTDHASLIQVAGQVSPPSSHGMRTPPPQVAQMRLQEGGTYKFNGPTGQEVAEVFWDGFDNGGGEFILKESTNRGQVWVSNNGIPEPLNGNTYAMSDGMTLGFGPHPDRSQWYVFKDGTLTALQQGRRPRAATEPMSPSEGMVIEFPAGAQPIKLGRKELGGSANISNQHLSFTFHDKGWWVKDLGSSNGTYQNNQLISKGKGQEGEWRRVSTNDILSLGGVHFVFRLRPDGGIRLEQIQTAPAPMEPIPVSIPPSYVPSRTPQAFGPPSFNGSVMNLGWARVVRIVENKGELGLQPVAEGEEPAPREYKLNLNKGGLFRGLFEKDLARIEDMGEGRYRIENVGFKQGMSITNPAKGKNITVGLGRSDQALAGDTLEFDGQKITLQP